MKTLLSITAFSLVVSANAQLWNQSNLANLPGGGTGGIAGADISQLETGETIFGYGAQIANNNIMADDFTVSSNFTITGITLFAYQTGETTPTVNAVNWAVASTAQNTGLTSTSPTVSFTNIYRTVSGDTSTSNRRIQRVDITGLNMNMAAGTYFLSAQFGGTGASGPWSPPLPTSLAAFGQNAQQSLAGGAFAPVVQGAVGADMAFIIHGTAVPEPATMTVLGLGALAMLRRRRK